MLHWDRGSTNVKTSAKSKLLRSETSLIFFSRSSSRLGLTEFEQLPLVNKILEVNFFFSFASSFFFFLLTFPYMSMSNSATNTKDAFNLGVLLGRKNEVDGEGPSSQHSGFSPVGSCRLEACLAYELLKTWARLSSRGSARPAVLAPATSGKYCAIHGPTP